MSKEKRLGRGLEALLGRLATKTDETMGQPPSAVNAPMGESHRVSESLRDSHLESQPVSEKPAHVDAHAGDGLDDPYGGLGTSYEAPRSQSRRPSLPGMGSVARSFGTLAADHETGDGGRGTGGGATDEVAASSSSSSLIPHPSSLSPPPGPLRVPLREIESNPFQPRQDFDEDEIQSLCDSLRAHGLLQPIVVRSSPGGYQLVAGERRLRAAIKAGWSEVPVQVVEADDRQLAELALVENLQRKDLNPLEKAASFQRYLQEYGSTQEELAARLKLDRSTISNFIRLLELPEEVQQSLREGTITQGHARSLLPLGDEREQLDLCRRIHQEGLSVRHTEALVQEMIDRSDAEPLSLVSRNGGPSRPRRPVSEHVAVLEQQFRAALGTRVKITHSAHGKGKLVIHFDSHEEFERIREHICGPEHPELRSQAG